MTDSVNVEQCDLNTVRSLLDALSSDQLEAIGVKITKPNPDQWFWLRDIMSESLIAIGREKAGKLLSEYPFGGVHTTYSVGISAELLSDMARRIAIREPKP